MKVVILAGGYGTRLSEETKMIPKPLVEIGGRPIIWHIMKHYSRYGHNDFLVLCGYKSEMLKKYFVDYFTVNYDIEVDLEKNSLRFVGNPTERWKVTLIDTGLNTMTGGRIKRAAAYLNETFMLTYGDGVGDVDISALLAAHQKAGRLATVTAVPSPGRFGILKSTHDGVVESFSEKPLDEKGMINAGFFVMEPGAVSYIDGDLTSWEREPMRRLVADGELNAYHHEGFWRPMDSLRDKTELEALWESGDAPWASW